MKVSIIIPVYNAEKYLKECIESALNQTYNDIEVIAIDDGSTDSSLNILKKYSDKIKIIQQTNHGTSSASNTGIKNSTGEWIKRLDADNVLYPNAVEILVKEIKAFGKGAESCIFYAKAILINSAGEKLYDSIEPNYNNLSNFEYGVILLNDNLVRVSATLVHKSVFEKYCYFNEQNRYLEDYEFWLRLALIHNCKFFLISKIIVKKRLHKDQKTVINHKKNRENAKVIKKEVLDKLEPSLKAKYLQALKDYKKINYPLKTKILLYFAELLIQNDKIYNLVTNSKITNQIYFKLRYSRK